MNELSSSYEELISSLTSLLSGESDSIALLSQFTAFVYHQLPELSWVGIYLLKDNQLVLGPFQGKPACYRIPLGKGVCGTSAKEQRTLVVDNVNDFPDHIACDAGSESEIVIPLKKDRRLIGVLDIDSYQPGRFSSQDKVGLEKLSEQLVLALNNR